MKRNDYFYKLSLWYACYAVVIFSFFISSIAHADRLDKGEVWYKMKKSWNSSDITVETTFIGNESGKTIVYIPVALNTDSLKVDSKFGTIKPEELEPCLQSISLNTCVVASISHAPSEVVSVTYRIPVIGVLDEDSTVEYALSSTKSLFFDKSRALIFPDLNDKKQNKIFVDYSDLTMQNARIIFRNKVHDMSSSINISKDEFFDGGYFLFSNDAIRVSKFNTNPSITFVSAGLPEKSSDTQVATHVGFADAIKKIWSYNQKFVNDILPEKLKSITAQEKVILLINDEDEKNNERYNNGRDNGFYFLHRSYTKEHENYVRSLNVLSYLSLLPVFYNLLPNTQDFVLPNTQDFAKSIQNRYGWLSGISVYYAHLLNFRSGVISEEEYIGGLNDLIYYYFKHCSKMEDSFASGCVHQERYDSSVHFKHDAGTFLAFILDSTIQQRSFQKKNMDSFLKGMFTHCWEYPCSFSKEQFTNAFFVPENLGLRSSWIGYLLNKHLNNLYLFTPADFPSLIMDGKYQLKYKPVDKMAVYGFDFSGLLCTGIINHIEEDSAAFKAGLRNGDLIIDADKHSGEHQVELQIQNKDGTKKTVKYNLIDSGKVPYYEKVTK